MYIYGLTIGMNFNDIANILMSPVGNVIKNLLNNDSFSERDLFNAVDERLFKYFTEGPYKQVMKYDIRYDSKGNKLTQSPVVFLTKKLSDILHPQKPQNLSTLLTYYANKSISLSEKIEELEKLRKVYKGETDHAQDATSTEAIEIYNQLIDFVEDYIMQSDIINKHKGYFNDIITLSEGAQEMKLLGQILSLNQGLKTSSDEFLKQINNLRRAIYDKTGILEDLVDLTKFAFDESEYVDPQTRKKYPTYREYIIQKYENYKHSFNIFDVVSKVPHFMGYLKTLATAYVEVNNSFTFRSTDNLLLYVKDTLGKYIKEDKLVRGLQNYCGDWLLKHWLLDTESERTSIIVPAGNQAFDKNGNLYTLTEDKLLHLGLDEDNATFRLWMENEVIPNLKEGIIQPGKVWPKISNNRFIRDLGFNLYNKTISGNNSIVQALPINMLPSTDTERNLFNLYKSQFNSLTDGYVSELHRNVEINGEVRKETYLSDPISIVDLITYYSMIAYGWKLDQSSLVSITEDFQNIGIIKSFHDYIAEIDKSGFILDEHNTDWDEMLPYVAPSESPFTASAAIIWAKNRSTQKRVLMYDARKEEIEGKIGKYYPINTQLNLNFFGTNQISKGQGVVTMQVSKGKITSNIRVSYDLRTGYYKVKVNAIGSNVVITSEDLQTELAKHLNTIPFIIQNKAKIPNTQLLKQCIDNIINNCN